MNCITFSNIKKFVEHDDKRLLILNMEGEITIQRGEFVCVTGPSGSGKTTLLSILGLLDFDYEGNFTLHCCGKESNFKNIDPDDRDDTCQVLRRSIGFIFQDVKVQPQKTALENATAVLQYQGVSKKTRNSLAKQALLNLDIEIEQHHRRVSSFSGGMQQRVGIARALVNNPEFIFADEPTAHLDDVLANEIYQLLQKRCNEDGITTIVITHNPQLLTFADRVIELVKREDNEGFDIQTRQQPKEAIQENHADNHTISLTKPPIDTLKHENLNDSTSSTLTIKPIFVKGLIKEMFLEAKKELMPLFHFGLWLCFGWWIRIIPSPKTLSFIPQKPPPLHHYLSNAASISICALLFATAFLFQLINNGIQSYQDSIIQEQYYFRQVVVQPSTSTNQRSLLDIKNIEAYMSSKDIHISDIDPIYDLGGYAALPADIRHVQVEKKWPIEMLQKFKEQSTKYQEDVDDRLSMRLIAFDDGDPSLQDYGITGPISSKEKGDLPYIYIRNSQNDWKNLGSFEQMPSRNDIVYIVFESEKKMKFDTEVRSQRLCVQFKVAGKSKIQSPKLEFAKDVLQFNNLYYHAIIFSDVQKSILDWQQAPMNGLKTIPKNWLCPKVQDIEDASELAVGEKEDVSVPQAYRFTMKTPLDAQKFHIEIQHYAKMKNFPVTLTSEQALIEMILAYKNLTQQIGIAISGIPIILCAVFILLTIQTIMSRKHNDLLLYRVMGSPNMALYIQSNLLSLFILLPGIIGGIIIAYAAQGLMNVKNDFIEIPDELIQYIQQASLLSNNMAIFILFSFTICISILVSSLSVQSVIDDNPTSVFRGG